MTEGSSQGLFVIVAVVIFGIFVAISSVIFKDNLRPALANIFNDSIMQSKVNASPNLVHSFKSEIFSSLEGLRDFEKISEVEYIIDNMKETSNHHPYFGVRIGKNSDFKLNTDYLFSFDVTLLDGNINFIGGHFPYEGDIYSIKIDSKEYDTGSKYKNSWTYMTPYTLVKDKKASVSLHFNTGEVLASYDGSFTYFQPNRANPIPDNYRARVSNIRLVEL